MGGKNEGAVRGKGGVGRNRGQGKEGVGVMFSGWGKVGAHVNIQQKGVRDQKTPQRGERDCQGRWMPQKNAYNQDTGCTPYSWGAERKRPEGKPLDKGAQGRDRERTNRNFREG